MSLLYTVDDDESMLLLYGALFKRSQHRVRFFTNAAAAIDAFDAERPDLLITDLDMPGLSGLQLIERVRSRASGSDIPILLISSKVRDGELPGGHPELQIDAVLSKSSVRHLPRQIEALLRGHQTERCYKVIQT